jgi:hypothetical protein
MQIFDYFEYLGVGLLWAIAKFSALFFVLSILLLIFCLATRMFKRRNFFLNILTCLYYPYIFIVMMSFAAIWSTANYVKTETLTLLDEAMPAANQAAAEYLRQMPSAAWDRFSEQNAEREVENLLCRENLLDNLPPRVCIWGVRHLVAPLTTEVVKTLKEETQETQITKKGLLLLVENGRVAQITLEKIAGFFDDYLRRFLIAFAIALAIPFLETLVSKSMERFIPEKSPPPPPRNIASTGSEARSDILEQLEKLYALKEKGVLSQAEFDQKKQKLLAVQARN